MTCPKRQASHGWLLAVAVMACSGAAAALASPEPLPPTPAEPIYTATLPSDRVGRMLATVEINGSGPYRFIIDLGANRSALSVRLAQALGLMPGDGSAVEVHGVTGSAMVPLARVDEMRVGGIVLSDQDLPVLGGAVFANADGILGIDGLQQARIEVDIDGDRVKIGMSDKRRAPQGYLAVPARLVSQGLLLVEGRVGNVPTKVVIDTGAEYSIGNLQLQRALAERDRRRDRQGAVVSGATPGTLDAVRHAAPGIVIGEARLQNLPVTFSDLHVFNLWGLSDQPALIVGMDVLGTVEKFVVDYGRREFQLKARPPVGAAVIRCNLGNCATRLRRPTT